MSLELSGGSRSSFGEVLWSRETALAWGLYVLAVVPLYFTTRSVVIIGDDGADYLRAIESGENLFHPHHWLFNPVNRVWLVMFKCLGATARTVVATHNVLWVVLSAIAVFLILRFIGCRALGAGLGGFYVVVSNAYWYFSNQYEVYPAASGSLLLFCVGAFVSEAWVRWARIVVLSLLLSLAVLYYQANVLFVIVIAFAGVLVGCRTRSLLLLFGGAGILVLIVYVAGFLAEYEEWNRISFARYVFLYSGEDSKWGHLSNVGLTGAKRMFGGCLDNYFIPTLEWRPVVLRVFGAVSGLGLAGALLALKGGPRKRMPILCTILWVVVFAVFLWWWGPDTELRAILFSPVHLLLLLGLGHLEARVACDGRGRWRTMIALFCLHGVSLAAILATNYTLMSRLAR